MPFDEDDFVDNDADDPDDSTGEEDVFPADIDWDDGHDCDDEDE
jgi:hypothetical protein